MTLVEWLVGLYFEVMGCDERERWARGERVEGRGGRDDPFPHIPFHTVALAVKRPLFISSPAQTSHYSTVQHSMLVHPQGPLIWMKGMVMAMGEPSCQYKS